MRNARKLQLKRREVEVEGSMLKVLDSEGVPVTEQRIKFPRMLKYGDLLILRKEYIEITPDR